MFRSNYIPWKGYFDIIAAVDEFILYDDMQYHPTRLAQSEPDQNAKKGSNGLPFRSR